MRIRHFRREWDWMRLREDGSLADILHRPRHIRWRFHADWVTISDRFREACRKGAMRDAVTERLAKQSRHEDAEGERRLTVDAFLAPWHTET